MTDTVASLTARIAALRTAYDALLTGERVQRISYDGGTVEYATPPKPDDLLRAIRESEIKLAQLTGGNAGMRFIRTFGA